MSERSTPPAVAISSCVQHASHMPTEIGKRAERRGGELMAEARKAGLLVKPPGGSKKRPKKGWVSRGPDHPTLAAQNIDKHLADRMRKAGARLRSMPSAARVGVASAGGSILGLPALNSLPLPSPLPAFFTPASCPWSPSLVAAWPARSPAFSWRRSRFHRRGFWHCQETFCSPGFYSGMDDNPIRLRVTAEKCRRLLAGGLLDALTMRRLTDLLAECERKLAELSDREADADTQ